MQADEIANWLGRCGTLILIGSGRQEVKIADAARARRIRFFIKSGWIVWALECDVDAYRLKLILAVVMLPNRPFC